MRAVILAAGRGSRLGTLRAVSSKAALPLLGRALITRVYETIPDIVESVTIVVNPDDRHLLDVLRSAQWANVDFELALQTSPLGSACALRIAINHFEGPCVVLACDNLMSAEFLRAFISRFQTQELDALVAVASINTSTRLPSSVVAMEDDGSIYRIIEKPDHEQLISDSTALPLYAFRPSIYPELDALSVSSRGEYEIPQAIQNFIDRGGVVKGMAAQKRITINSPPDYGLAVARLLDRSETVLLETGVEISTSAELMAPVYIESSARIEANAHVGPSTYVMSGASVGEAAVVRDSILFRNAQVASRDYVANKIVLPPNHKAIDLQKSRGNRDRVHRP